MKKQLLTLACFCLTLSACHSTKESENAPFVKIDNDTIEINDTAHVTISKLEKKKFPITVDLPGRITIPDKDLFVLTSRVQGRIESIVPSIGDLVSSKSILANIWSADLATAVEEYEIAKKQGEKSLIELSEMKLNSMGLLPTDAKPNLASYPLRSSLTGVVIDRKLNSGAAIQPGDTILTIGKTNSYTFQGELPPDQAMKLKAGMNVVFEAQESLTAKVQSVSPLADPTSRLVRIRCSFDKTIPALPQETLLKGSVILHETDSIVAPSKALILLNDGEYVFVKIPGSKNRFKRVKILVETRHGKEMAIHFTSSFPDDSEVIAEGALLLNASLETSYD